MKLTEDTINRFCIKVLTRLKKEEELVFKVDEQKVLAAMKDSIIKELHRKDDVIKEAEKMLAQYEVQMGDQIDKGKMLRMIKEKLFKERNIVL